MPQAGGSANPARPVDRCRPSIQCRVLVLASQSPQRRRLLSEAGLSFDVDPAGIDEADLPPGLGARAVAVLLAVRKARAVHARRPGDVVVGSDTVVAVDVDRREVQLGKPTDEADARRMIALLAGTTHRVITGVAVVGRFDRSIVDEAEVDLREMTAEEVDAYVAGGSWRGKAGGYGLQNDDPFVTATRGRRDTIIGLPVPHVKALLAGEDEEESSVQAGAKDGRTP